MRQQIYLLSILILCCLSVSLKAQKDKISFQFDDVVNKSMGSITITANHLLYDEKIIVTPISTPANCDFPFLTKNELNETNKQLSVSNIGDKCIGEYCFQVESNKGLVQAKKACYTEICIEIKECSERMTENNNLNAIGYANIYCLSTKSNHIRQKNSAAIFITGNTSFSNDKSIVKTAFDVYSSNTIKDDITENIYSKTQSLLDEIVRTGQSSFDIPKQSEIETQGDFVLKFDTEGNIIWVWHDNIEQIVLTTESSYFILERVYPNPFSTELNLEITTSFRSPANVVIYDLLGQNIYSEDISLEAGSNKITLQPKIDFKQGIYLLKISDEKGNSRITKIHYADFK